MNEQAQRKKIVVGVNSLTEAQYPAYSNHCQMWFRFVRSYAEFDFIFVNTGIKVVSKVINLFITNTL